MTANGLYYTSPALNWLDGLPLGSGRVGAMVLATQGHVRLQVNDGTAWSGSPASEHRCGAVSPEIAAVALASARAVTGRGFRGMARARGRAQDGKSATRLDSCPDDCANAEAQGEADERAVKDSKAHGDSDGGSHEAADPQRFIHWTCCGPGFPGVLR